MIFGGILTEISGRNPEKTAHGTSRGTSFGISARISGAIFGAIPRGTPTRMSDENPAKIRVGTPT